MHIHTVTGGAGLRLHVREWGPAHGTPILLLHGWSQSHQCWMRQYDSGLADEFRLVAPDLRGHGMSDAPPDPAQYQNGDLWADDVAAIIAALNLDRPILAGWSYGGLVIGDYLRRHGATGLGGIAFIGALTAMAPALVGRFIGPGFSQHAPKAMKPDLPTAIEGVRAFLRACFAHPVPPDVFEQALAWNMVVQPLVRRALAQREVDFTPLLRNVGRPMLVVQGRADTVVLPAMAKHILAECPAAEAAFYDTCGHAPFLEEPDRFNADLTAFARRARG
ncbi:MAG TPA: alpha/beta hydrolase [Acetobacteraceae bacterium]|nr:alpha/beta hydrolase [Acetobacteraceae bacterium]